MINEMAARILIQQFAREEIRFLIGYVIEGFEWVYTLIGNTKEGSALGSLVRP